jgi:PPK2 family polyphosphate:nucleotide phosphotransferase
MSRHDITLAPVDPRHVPALDDDEARRPDDAPRGDAFAKAIDDLHERLRARQALLAADGRHAVLVVLQGRDTSGKDGTIREVFAATNPQGTRVTAFAAPSPLELRHDYLWRVHEAAPPRGAVGIFNRSHYEDVLVARVRGLAPEATWSRRFRHIVEFERMLADEGTVILKFFLHISRAEQAERLRGRLDEPEKNWKFDEKDLEDRLRWDAFTLAYQDVFRHTSTDWAPWYVVPADSKKTRNLLVAQTIVQALERLELRPPALPEGKLEALRATLDAQLRAEEARQD